MCTVSAITSFDSICLFFNRDEQRQRPEALPLKHHHSADGCAYLAPIDPTGGGTWLALNDRGNAVGLLNYYPEKNGLLHRPDPACRRSRGRLVTTLAALPAMELMHQHLAGSALEPFPPFHCFLLSANGIGFVCHWDGHQRNLEPIRLPWFFTTSSFRPREVTTCRKKQFEAHALTSQSLRALHWDPGRAPDAYACRMARTDARTVSISSLQWNLLHGDFRYVPIANNGTPGPEQHESLRINRNNSTTA